MVTNSDWSKLCPDVLRKIFETLEGPVDCHRAKTVCSDWYAIWKTWENRPQCPMQIIHLGDSPTTTGEGTRKLFGLSKKSYCMASSGYWILMVDRPLKFCIFNLLTREKISLPSLMESPIPGEKNSAVLWINEKTRDYVVAWSFTHRYLLFLKKGDDSWCNLNLDVLDMACEKSKVYILTTNQQIKIIDFSGEIPREEITENPYWNHPFDFVLKEWEYIWKRKIAVRESGEVLIILSLKEVLYQDRLLFYIFKMNLESFKWERVYSIGDEMLVFGHGFTVGLTLKDPDDGIKSDSIYFVDDDVWPDHQDHDHQDHDHRTSNCGVFDIATSRIEWPEKICYMINSTQWFVPGVAY